jgi:hypothetical protein
MRCSIGDLCIVVADRTNPANAGALVRVLAAADNDYFDVDQDWEVEALTTLRYPTAPEPYLQTVLPGEIAGFLDRELRPLRDNDGEDEVLRIAGKPCVWLELEGLL